jgi:hypothetical protein
MGIENILEDGHCIMKFDSGGWALPARLIYTSLKFTKNMIGDN